MITKKWDMRILYISYEEALKTLSDPANQTGLLNMLQIIQEAAILDEILSDEEQPLCTNINSYYSHKGETRSSEEIIRDLSTLIENIAHHNLQWLQLEPNKTKVKAFLTIATRISKNLLQSLLTKKAVHDKRERTKTKPLRSIHSEKPQEDDESILDQLTRFILGKS